MANRKRNKNIINQFSLGKGSPPSLEILSCKQRPSAPEGWLSLRSSAAVQRRRESAGQWPRSTNRQVKREQISKCEIFRVFSQQKKEKGKKWPGQAGIGISSQLGLLQTLQNSDRSRNEADIK